MYQAAFVAAFCGDHLLLVRRKDNSIGLPGGKINKDETPEQAARREFFEETGLICETLIPVSSAPIGASLVKGFITVFDALEDPIYTPGEVTPFWGNFDDLLGGPDSEIISFNRRTAQCYLI